MRKEKIERLMDRIDNLVCYSNDKVFYDGKLETQEFLVSVLQRELANIKAELAQEILAEKKCEIF